MTLTWQKMTELEPMLADLEYVVSAIDHQKYSESERADMWYTVFKPMFSRLAGWGRTEERKQNELAAKEMQDMGINLVSLPGDEQWKKDREILESIEAYDIGYEYLIDVLEV